MIAEEFADKPTDLPWVMDVAVGIAEALGHGHEKKLLHLNLTPSNILICEDRSKVKVLNFGMVWIKAPSDSLGDPTPSGPVVKSPAILAPEMWYDIKETRPASDFYSLGVVLFYAIARRLPFQGRNIMYQHIQERPPSLRELRPDVPKRLEAVVEKLLAKDQDDRYQHAAPLIEDLRHALNEPKSYFGWLRFGRRNK